MTTKRTIPSPALPSVDGAGLDQMDEETVDEVLVRVTTKYVGDPPTLDPDHPFFTHEPVESTGRTESAANADEHLYE